MKSRHPSPFLRLGLDIGSVNMHAALLDGSDHPLKTLSVPIKGDTPAALAAVLNALKDSCAGKPVSVAVTGRGRDILDGIADVAREGEITASARAARSFAPQVRGLIEVGGHFSKWVQFDEEGEVQDYSLNGLCAAGSGAFLEQQAARLRLSISDLAALAATAPAGAAIAGRCSVFAKSDMIHQQQKGTPVAEIAYGLCLALARNYAATVLKGREPVWPAAFIGGGAANHGLLRAFREILRVAEKDILVPDHASLFGAFGAALSAKKTGSILLEELSARIAAPSARAALPAMLPPLPHPEPVEVRQEQPALTDDGIREVFLGVDVGSVSTDFALLDPQGQVVQGVYLPTRGRPIEAIQEGLAILREKLGDRAKILAVGTTGSGRHLAAQFLKADLARNEITAQIKSTVHYFPDVDTVFEIGGQDSKYISAQNGSIRDFVMNKICAAGTGSFLEEQAGQLNLDIIGGFEEVALKSRAPADLGSRCTVFMETELVNALPRGTTVPDAAAGLAYSVAQNYLQKVVGQRKIGRCVVFQGGVASNRAVVAAFSQLLGRSVKVHPYNRLSGAIGAALIVREAYLEQPFATGFIGFDGDRDYTLSSFECKHCSNMCQVTRMKRGSDLAFFGDVCERHTTGAVKKGELLGVPDLCAEREALLEGSLAGILPRPAPPAPDSAIDRFLTRYGVRAAADAGKTRGTIGIPRASLYFELLPLWSALFQELGYEVVLSSPSSNELLAKGIRKLSSDACLPVKLAYSHSLDLASGKADFIFLPSILDLPAPFGSPEHCSTCPYTQSLPYMVRSAVQGRFLIPQINMSIEIDGLPEGLEVLADALGVGIHRLRAAYQLGKEAHLEFKASLLRRGDEILASRLDWAVVLIGKPYNVYDSFLNLNLVRHLARLGVTAIPYEFISKAGSERLDQPWDELPWRFNRDYIKAALAVRADPRLYPIVVSNFGCGPDGFTIKHLENILEGRPSLQLEFDEHRGEAGMVTRLEAFLDEIAAHRAKGTARRIPPKATPPAPKHPPAGRRFYIPHFADHARIYAGILRHVGLDAEVLPPPTDAVRRKGEKVSSGKECHPYTLLAGDLVHLVESRKPSDPPGVFFFPGTSIPCLMRQYGPGHRLILDQMGASSVSVMTPDNKDLRDMIGYQGGARLWRGFVAMDLLVKLSCELRPYEAEKGSVDTIHRNNCLTLEKAVESGDVLKAAKLCVERLSTLELDTEGWKARRKPIVGVAGDIYTRANRFANQNLYANLEAMGCEVWPAPFMVDLLDFGLKRAITDSISRRDPQKFFREGAILLVKELSERAVTSLFQQHSRYAIEPSFKDVVEIAAPYVGERASNVLMLNIAKMTDFARNGASGIVNAICFNCMVGSVSASITSKLRQDNGNIPIVNLVFGEAEGAAESLHLEAFIHQVKNYSARGSNKPARAAKSLLSRWKA